ncbi:MAG: oligosaccharide flippase family protein [Candidatus Nitrosocaldaceae archaeon]
MDKPFERLAKGSSFMLLSNLVNTMIGALFWLILAKIVEAESIGRIMIVIAFVTSIIGFSANGIQVTLAKYVAEYKAKNMHTYTKRLIKFGIIITLIIGLVVAIILSLLSNYIATYIYNNPSLTILLTFAALTFLPAQSIVAILNGVYQGLHKTQYILIISLIFQALRLLISISLIIYGLKEFGILTGFAIAAFTNSLLGYLIVHRVTKDYNTNDVPNKGEGLKHILSFSGFNYVVSGINTLTSQIGIITLGSYSIEWSAFYGIASLIAQIVGSVIYSVSSILLPVASEELTRNSNRENIRSIFNTVLRIALTFNGFIILLLIIEPNYILSIISRDYIDAATSLRILVIAYMITSINNLMISILNAVNKAKEVAIRSIISSIIIIVLTPLLALLFYMDGAAIALLLGSLTNLILLYIHIKKESFTISVGIFRPVISISIAVGIGYIISSSFNTLYTLLVSVIIYSIASLGLRAVRIEEVRYILNIVFTIIKHR